MTICSILFMFYVLFTVWSELIRCWVISTQMIRANMHSLHRSGCHVHKLGTEKKRIPPYICPQWQCWYLQWMLRQKVVLVYQFTFRMLKHFICTKQTRHKSGQIRSYSKDYANVVPIHMDTSLAKTWSTQRDSGDYQNGSCKLEKTV